MTNFLKYQKNTNSNYIYPSINQQSEKQQLYNYEINKRTSNQKNLPPPKKFNFKSLKKNTCQSLNDVEYFLNNFSVFIKYVRLFKILK